MKFESAHLIDISSLENTTTKFKNYSIDITKRNIGGNDDERLRYIYEFSGEESIKVFNYFYTRLYQDSITKETTLRNRLGKLPLDLRELVNESLGIIRDAIKRYSFDKLAFSFNGGKDCTVLLHLIRMAQDSVDAVDKPLKTVYILPKSPFDEVEKFCSKAAIEYNLELKRFNYPMKKGLQEFMDENGEIEGIFLGVRRSDPYASSMTSFMPTSKGWPEFMRINPILDWKYHHIWTFLRTMEIAYCRLYDWGYTSLGSTEDTIPNPELLLPCAAGDNSDQIYNPAYLLSKEDAERDGRLPTPP